MAELLLHCQPKDHFVLPLDLQQYIAGNTQRVAKLLAQQADFEVPRLNYSIHGMRSLDHVVSMGFLCSFSVTTTTALLKAPLRAQLEVP